MAGFGFKCFQSFSKSQGLNIPWYSVNNTPTARKRGDIYVLTCCSASVSQNCSRQVSRSASQRMPRAISQPLRGHENHWSVPSLYHHLVSRISSKCFLKHSLHTSSWQQEKYRVLPTYSLSHFMELKVGSASTLKLNLALEHVVHTVSLSRW